jgi:hypothetical protein
MVVSQYHRYKSNVTASSNSTFYELQRIRSDRSSISAQLRFLFIHSGVLWYTVLLRLWHDFEHSRVRVNKKIFHVVSPDYICHIWISFWHQTVYVVAALARYCRSSNIRKYQKDKLTTYRSAWPGGKITPRPIFSLIFLNHMKLTDMSLRLLLNMMELQNGTFWAAPFPPGHPIWRLPNR